MDGGSGVLHDVVAHEIWGNMLLKMQIMHVNISQFYIKGNISEIERENYFPKF